MKDLTAPTDDAPDVIEFAIAYETARNCPGCVADRLEHEIIWLRTLQARDDAHQDDTEAELDQAAFGSEADYYKSLEWAKRRRAMEHLPSK